MREERLQGWLPQNRRQEGIWLQYLCCTRFSSFWQGLAAFGKVSAAVGRVSVEHLMVGKGAEEGRNSGASLVFC